MKRVAAITVALLATVMLDCGSAHAQARGASAKETLEKGQPIEGKERWVRYKDAYVPYSVVREGPEAVQRFIDLLSERVGEHVSREGPHAVQRIFSSGTVPGPMPDAATMAYDVMQMETWLRRVPGRFRVVGRILMQETHRLPGGDLIPLVLSGEIGGIADCSAVGEGVGAQCILNATWPAIDLDVSRIDRPSVSEAVKTLQPGVLVLGLDLNRPGILALLVTDESIANPFSGELIDNTLAARGFGICPPALGTARDRCLSELRITAEPESGIVTITMIKPLAKNQNVAYLPETDYPDDDPRRTPPADQLIITLTMHRDPEAQAVVPMKTKKVR